jgi:GTP cyclohydrolase II
VKIVEFLGIRSVILITNNPEKVQAFENSSVRVASDVHLLPAEEIGGLVAERTIRLPAVRPLPVPPAVLLAVLTAAGWPAGTGTTGKPHRSR